MANDQCPELSRESRTALILAARLLALGDEMKEAKYPSADRQKLKARSDFVERASDELYALVFTSRPDTEPLNQVRRQAIALWAKQQAVSLDLGPGDQIGIEAWRDLSFRQQERLAELLATAVIDQLFVNGGLPTNSRSTVMGLVQSWSGDGRRRPEHLAPARPQVMALELYK